MEEDERSEERKSYDESAYKILTLLWFFVLLIIHDENAEF